MRTAICSIQRNRGRWLHEWIAFHSLVGFDCFYIYLHKCTDNSYQIVNELSKIYDIKTKIVADNVNKPQLWSYADCFRENFESFNWVAFLDGDEFLFNRNGQNINEVLAEFTDVETSAVGVYWACYGSSGHVLEPNGFLIENYTHRADESFAGNSHIKSIVRSDSPEMFGVLNDSHYFKTRLGTHDTNLKKILHGDTMRPPVYDKIVINHYATQSYQFFKDFKQNSGAADASPNQVREASWWYEYDRNEVHDIAALIYLPKLKAKIEMDKLTLLDC